jgi:LacI family transcriptional regulator
MEGVAEYCRHEGLEMSIFSSDVEDLNRCDIVRELRRREADGAIILRATNASQFLENMESQKFPYFCLFNSSGQAMEKMFRLDDEALAYKAVRYLISLGHRKIGIILDRMMYTTVRARYEGYLQAMKDAGLDVDPALVFSPDKDMKDFSGGGLQIGTEGIKVLLDRVPGMTAVFTTADMISRSVVGWLYQHGIRVPDRISVMGFDDYPETAWLCPPLTTICVPYKEIGYEGARQVHRLFRGLDVLINESVQEKISGELVIRKSTSPVVG